MKKIILSIALMLLVATKMNAQVMASKPVWVTIKSANLHCWECRELLDKYLFDENNQNMENGMLKWTFNLIAGEIRVQYLPDRVSVDEIKTAMNNAGFYADTAKAEPTVYIKLPPACKLPSEGGGPKKGVPCHLQPN
jgi:hypothetical protein